MSNWNNPNYRRWMLQAVAGILLFNAGICMICECTILKYEGAPLLEWMWKGTVSLSVFTAGMCLFVDSLRYRLRL